MTSKPKKSKRIRNAPGATRTRLSASPLSRLKNSLDIYEFTAADEIIAAFRMANGLPVSRDPDLDIPISPLRFGAADEHAAKVTDLVRIYLSWRRDLAGTAALSVVDAVLMTETPLSELDARAKARKGTAREHLATALKHFAALRGNVPRGARNWKYVPPTPPVKKEKAA